MARLRRAVTPAIALAVFLFNAALNRPLFLPGEMPFRGSIEGGYAGMARFISAHPNPWGWNPFQYCGLPTQFLYVPLLPYATALAGRIAPSVAPDYAYRLITAVAACLGPAALFFFALHFTGSRRWALAVALAYSLFSPAYGLFPQVEKDRGIVQLPWRIQVLAKYGEGPHNAGLALLPVALLAVWLAGKRRGHARLFAAATLLAAIPLTNWVSAFALAIACGLLLVAAIGEPEFRAWRPVAAAGLAYLLAAFWLTPTFIQTIAFNWPADSFGYHFVAPQRRLLLGLAIALAAIRLACAHFRASFYFCFTLLCALAFGWFATAYYVYGIDTIPESRRYALEFELFLALAVAEAFRLSLRSKNQTVRLCVMGSAGVMFLVGLPQLWAYATQGQERWTPVPPPTTIEYRLAKWLDARRPQGRVFASGGLRFRLNSWFDLAQVGGGFETGLRNRMPLDLAYHVRTGRSLRPGREPADTLLELQALNVQYVVAHGPKSKEYYRDYSHPEWLASVLTEVYREGDDAIFEAPARPLAHLVRPDDLPGDDAGSHPERLEPYVRALGADLRTQWIDTSHLTIDGATAADRIVSVQMNADPGWRAAQDGRDLPIGRDALGFMVLRPAAEPVTHIDLRYRGTTEQRAMAVLSIVAWIGAFAGLFLRK